MGGDLRVIMDEFEQDFCMEFSKGINENMYFKEY